VSYYATTGHRSPVSSGACGNSSSPGDSTSPALDHLSLSFVIWAQEAGATSLDVGCGDGIATLALLARGGHVVAVDPDAAALHRLIERAPAEQCRRLRVRMGNLPNLDFKVAHFAAIHAARVLHLLDPVAAEQSLRKFYRWLSPEGRLFISARRIRPTDEKNLRREISAAGFFVEEASTYLPPWEGSQECCAVIARRPS
jgi:SAM-dependent methyltransferase